ncbi:MAG: putative DNA binding domain-containing protein [Bacteroidales bacterium]|nr:putative DNA binding domain-containing protein [Bacteroidales bacterium]
MIDDIKQTYGENTTCDFKEAVERKQPKSWLKSVSAFANTVGGVLVFGVNDDGETIGLENAKADAEFISDRIKVFMDPVPEFELVTKPTENGRFILELHVLAGDMTPYYYVNSGTHSAFIRIGDESVIANAHQLSALVLKGRNRTYDSLVTEYHLGELTFDTLAKTYQKQTGLPFEDKLLQSFSLVTDDGLLTQAGVLFSDQCPYRHSSLYCTRWDGLEKDDALDSREYQGNLLTLLDAGVQFMTLHNKKGWIKLPNRRLDTPDYSDRALFEALVNALIHRDYSELGSEVHIDIYDNRLVIYSPGGMFDGSLIQNRDVNEVPSRRRNPILADVFTQFGYMEKRGSGLRKIRNETAKLPGFTNEKRPTFRSQYESFFTEILNNNYSDESQGKVQNDTHDVVKDVAKELLLCIEADRFVTAEALAKKLSMSARQVQRLLAQLQNDNLIKRKGGRKTGHWELLYTSDVSEDVVKDVVKKEGDVAKDFSLNISANDNENASANDVGVVKDVVKKEDDVVKELLLSIKADGFVTAETLAKKLSMSARQVQRLLAQLQKDNLIIRKGGRKTGHWEVICSPNVPQDDNVNVSVNVAQNVAVKKRSNERTTHR